MNTKTEFWNKMNYKRAKVKKIKINQKTIIQIQKTMIILLIAYRTNFSTKIKLRKFKKRMVDVKNKWILKTLKIQLMKTIPI